MQSKSLLTLTALSAAFLLPSTGAFAQDNANNNNAQYSNTVMDAGQFRGALNRVKDLFGDIRENHTLALAAQDTLIASQYQNENRRLLVDVLGVLDSITANWKQTPVPAFSGETAELRSRSGISRWGTANAEKYASESGDTAFVRNTVWQLQNRLLADKLNGRDPIVTAQMVEMLDAAISRAENPDFRVVRSLNRDVLNRRIEFAQREESSAPSISQEITRSETIETPAAVEETTIEERTEVAQAPATTEETAIEDTTMTEERFGAANLPQTGGNPALLYLLGSGLAGLGVFVRRRGK